jgi:SAM-dependent methyltransferase
MNSHQQEDWFENEDFWEQLFPFMFPEKRLEVTVEDIEMIISLTKITGNSVLDLCCGPGRYCTQLAKAGYQVTGVDLTGFLLDKARARAAAAKVVVDWQQADMREFNQPESFDLVLNMFTSFGYFADPEDDQQVLTNIYHSLKPGGVCLIDVLGKERLARILQPTTSENLPDGSQLIQNHEIFADWTMIRNEWILIRDGVAKSFKFEHRIYSGQELKDRLRLAGFNQIELYGNLEGDQYGPAAQRLVAVGRKAS